MFSNEVNIAAKNHATEVFPHEACGIVSADTYIPCINIAEDTLKDFAIDNNTIQPYILNNTLQAIIHSHPETILKQRSSPSKRDMQSQMSLNVPFGIVDTDGTVVNDPYWWGDFILDEEILGQEFHHGINDCYTPIRKWYWQRRGIKLIDCARGDFWWQPVNDEAGANINHENLYVDGFEAAGFYRISKSELQEGDVILGKVRSPVINHAAIYLDNTVDGHGVVIHHLHGRLSRREPAGAWVNRGDLFLRYNNA